MSESDSSSAGGFRIDAALAAKINLADYLNAIPVLREVALINETQREAHALELCVDSVPAFLKPKVWHVESIKPGEQYHLSRLDVQLDGALLTRLSEAEIATVRFELRSRDNTGEALARLERTVELFPRSQWGGLSQLPDLVAAFVQPNDPAVECLLKKTAEVLRKHGKDAALNGYKGGGSRRTWELASALWTAVAAYGLDYALPPASFEHSGQKVRSPTRVLDAGLGTCFDLALLFCAALEQMGLNPIIVFTTGHAFTGVWLKQEEFSTTVVDDITALRKRVKLNELVLFETTVVTERPSPPFTRAVELGAQQIAEENEAKFELAVDIRRARLQRIKPLSGTDAVERKLEKGPDTEAETPFVEAPELPDEDSPEPVPVQDLTPKDRLVRWQRKLLDLSLRNNLLNFRSTKKALKLEAPDPGALEDLLAAGEALKLLPRPDLMDGSDPRDRAIYEFREREDVRRVHALDALRRREVFVGLPREELEARLIDLYRTARTNLQEGGANTLFLALGFLSWTRDDRQGQRYRAPLVLIPVALNRRSVRAGFALTLHEDEPRFNPTLLEMLRQDFDLHLGVADGELPKDESGLDVRGIWRTVSAAIKDIKGWEVTEDVVLAPFSFAKYLMWKDLTDRVDQLRENPVVRHLIDSPRESYPPGVPFPDSRRLDREIDPQCIFCPLPADSSQLSAVLATARGKDFVLIGPPGTGKSQTIANLIAHCLAEGKRVLFVSEKIAALDVVYRRLREVGLDDFCLELHSNKARKADVLAQLRRAWEARGHVDPEVWLAEAQRLKRLRDELNTYVERLHHRHSNGMSIFEAIGRVADGRDVPSIELPWGSAGTHSAADLQSMRDVVDRLGVNVQAVGIASIQTHPLAAIGHSEWSPKWQENVIASARQVLSVAKALRDAYEHFSTLIGLQYSPLDRRARGAVAVLARMLPQAAGHDWSFVACTDLSAVSSRLEQAKAQLIQHRKLSGALSPSWPESVRSACWKGVKLLAERREIHGRLGRAWSPDFIAELEKGLALLERIDRCRKALSVRYRQEVEQLNIAQLTHEWAQATASFWPFSWLRKRSVRKALGVHVEDGIELDVGQDLRLLAEIRILKEQVSSLDLARETDGIWAGLQTRIEFARTAIRFQSALDAARQGRSWEDVGFEAIANGRCGERLRDELERLCALKRLDDDLGELSELTSATENLWAGLATNSERLEAALRFQEALLEVRSKGTLAGEHEVVRRGECGATLARDFEVLKRRSEVERHITSFDDLIAVTAGVWSGLESRIEEIEAALKFAAPVSVAIDTLGNTSAGAAQLRTTLKRLLSGGANSLTSGGPIHTAGLAYLNAWNALQSALEQLTALGQFSQKAKLEFTELPLAELVSRCEAMILAEGRLRAWCAWRKVQEEAIGLGLGPLVRAVESGSLTAGQVRHGFETNYARWWLNAAVDEEPVIRNFVSAEHEKRIDDFRQLDERFTALTRALVRAKLCADIPMQDDIARGSEWSVLRYEINKRSRHMPLRELMHRIPTALAKLAPCLLMSPLSIAQYLAPDATSFDLVVFDEASQIPVWDAVGAIARGKQVVMVGDPKQLPPTSFFDRAEVDLDDEDVEADLESILDECLGANLPSMNLSWHYRSKSESLIAFSNHRYYGGGLVTFPSPLTNDRALSFHFVADGVYERGGARINRKEAQALVADLVGRLKSAEFRESKLTVGVVTFNAEQQALIEDLLDEERRKDPSIEPYFLETEIEPVFVKNLESVQGDERDIMYFSVTYGPDLTGVISMNFGPLNRQGGERRLNVAITRARHELRVFASLRPEQMDLSRTQAIGVRDLKHFLEFAERGPRALAEAVSGSTGGFESPLEESVAKALIGKGWEVHTQVGVSAFRIDIGVVHPDAKGAYLAGVECDGATYHRSATARDRDKLREQMLRRLGWTILRVWSTDWWLDRETTLEKLDSQLRKLLERDRMSRARESMEAESA